MHNLGETRSNKKATHLLQTPDTFVHGPLPYAQNVECFTHAAPALGARFIQYSAQFHAGGRLDAVATQRFVYVLDGSLQISIKGKEEMLSAGSYAYLPPAHAHPITADQESRAVVIEKPYLDLEGVPSPDAFFSHQAAVPSSALGGDESLQVQSLLPDDSSFDFAVNVMTYLPGASLPIVEIHVMEHGLLMLEGGGIYRLDKDWYPVTAGDFIWMAPYCPQWFGALGKQPAKYLIYKDWNRSSHA